MSMVPMDFTAPQVDGYVGNEVAFRDDQKTGVITAAVYGVSHHGDPLTVCLRVAMDGHDEVNRYIFDATAEEIQSSLIRWHPFDPLNVPA